jgi:type II secretory pathway component PulJ
VNLINNQALDLPPSKNREHGIGLIEILIAVVIMSMGFLAAVPTINLRRILWPMT